VPTNTKPNVRAYRGAIFDLDGVLVDTAKLHFKAWRRLAEELGVVFTETDNERLKGVSRNESLNILLSIGGLSPPDEERATLAEKKNRWYVELIGSLTPSDLLPGALKCLEELRRAGIPAALASASRNAPAVLKPLGIAHYFQAVLDGNSATKAKPDPEIFLAAATKLGILPRENVVFEDAPAGIQAAHAAGMYAVGIGKPAALPDADLVVADLSRCPLASLFGHGQ
jgi:beta-phosphoglucomutase